MTMKNIKEAKDPDLRASDRAMDRAGEAAWMIVIQTGTNLIVVKDGKLTRIPAQGLLDAPHKAMTDTNQKQLGNTPWNIAYQLRTPMNADDFRNSMLSFPFGAIGPTMTRRWQKMG